MAFTDTSLSVCADSSEITACRVVSSGFIVLTFLVLQNSIFCCEASYVLVVWLNKGNEFLAYVISSHDCDAGVPVGQMWPKTSRKPKFVLGFFGLDSVILTEGTVRNSVTRSGSKFANNYMGTGRLLSCGGPSNTHKSLV